jgi:hypothetical protein
MIGDGGTSPHAFAAAKKALVAVARFRVVYNPRLLEIVVGDGNDRRGAKDACTG